MSALPPHRPASVGLPAPIVRLTPRVAVMAADEEVPAKVRPLQMLQLAKCRTCANVAEYSVERHSTAWWGTLPGWRRATGLHEIGAGCRHGVEFCKSLFD